jgi:hypothetical protein
MGKLAAYSPKKIALSPPMIWKKFLSTFLAKRMALGTPQTPPTFTPIAPIAGTPGPAELTFT